MGILIIDYPAFEILKRNLSDRTLSRNACNISLNTWTCMMTMSFMIGLDNPTYRKLHFENYIT